MAQVQYLSLGGRFTGGGSTTFHVESSSLVFTFLDADSQELSILSSLFLGLDGSPFLKSQSVSLSLQNDGSDQTLDFGGFCGGFLSFFGGELTTDDILADVVLLGQIEHFSDFGGSLGSETLGDLNISQSWDVLLTLLDNNQGQGREIRSNDATTNRLSLALTGSAGSVAGVALREQETDTSRGQDTLLHGKTLLVVTSSNLEDVAFELVAEGITDNFGSHSLVVEDSPDSRMSFDQGVGAAAEESNQNLQFLLVINVKGLLGTRSRVGNVQLFHFQ